MRYVSALWCVAALSASGLVYEMASEASGQDVLFSESYSTPDYGYGFTTQTYGWSGQLGSPLTPYWSDSYTSADYGYGRRTSTFGYGYRVWNQPSYVFPMRRHRLRW